MNRAELKSIWKKEEKTAYIKGWDFRISMGGMRKRMICRGIMRRS